MNLIEVRNDIDYIDTKILSLLSERMELALMARNLRLRSKTEKGRKRSWIGSKKTEQSLFMLRS